jgi:tetratricopeptide (TPR) repeat protein
MRSLRRAIVALVAGFGLAIAVLALSHSATQPPSARARVSNVSLGAPSRPAASTDARIARFSAAARARPRDVEAHTALAAAFLQKARETADPAFYRRADLALRDALATRPDDLAALTTRGALRLSLHDFRAALGDAKRVLARAPDLNEPYGVLVDALVELGRYREAARALQTMVDRKPDLDAYARVAALRELTGDLPGAAHALRLAIAAGGEAPENTAFVSAMLGNLELNRGRPAAAAPAFRAALAYQPGYGLAEAGLARTLSARGHLRPAIRRLRQLVARLPLPQYVVELGETELAAGRPGRARRDLALLGVQQRLLRAAGVRTDALIALHEADHGRPRRAVALGREAWAAAPSVRSADALGWALTRAGRPRAGLGWARRALRLGSLDPNYLYHAGMAARAAGREALARRYLGRALRQAPHFSPLRAPRARRALRELGGEA